MSAEENLRAGNLTQALTELQQRVRQDPADAKLRVFLFQLLALFGRWDRAMTQLKVCGDLDAGTLAMVQTYRDALTCEALRTEVFAGNKAPLIFGQPEQWIALLLEALKLTAAGQYGKAQGIRDHAFELAPTTSGTIDGQAFDWIADADTRLGPVLEAIVNGRYYWVPFHRIKSIAFEEPADLRDQVWMPTYFTWSNGGETVGLIPTRYAGSEASEDAQIRLAQKTEWQEHPGDTYLGLGQRLLATDSGEFALMDVRSVELDTDEVTEEADRTAGSSDG